MNDIIRWVSTEPCLVCKGTNVDYRTRPWCKDCPSLLETLKQRGLLSKPPGEAAKKRCKMPQTMDEKIFAMSAAGATHREIAAATGLCENTVNNRIWKAHRAAGTVKHHRKRGEVYAK